MPNDEDVKRRAFGSLGEAFEHSGMSLSELWGAYLSLGGSSSPTEMEAYVIGLLTPRPLEHDILAQALNERFLDLGMNHPTPYMRVA